MLQRTHAKYKKALAKRPSKTVSLAQWKKPLKLERAPAAPLISRPTGEPHHARPRADSPASTACTGTCSVTSQAPWPTSNAPDTSSPPDDPRPAAQTSRLRPSSGPFRPHRLLQSCTRHFSLVSLHARVSTTSSAVGEAAASASTMEQTKALNALEVRPRPTSCRCSGDGILVLMLMS